VDSLYGRRIILALFWILLLNGQVLSPYGAGQVWGAADTLQPVTDNTIEWNRSGCDVDKHYDCVNDPPGSPDGEETKVYLSGAYKLETFQIETASMLGNIDSLGIRINGRKTGISSVAIEVGFEHDDDGWTWHGEGDITLSVSWSDYRMLSTGDEGDNAWTNAKINARRFGVKSKDPGGIWSANVTQIFVIVYYAEAAGKPSEPIVRESEDARGICRGRIVR